MEDDFYLFVRLPSFKMKWYDNSIFLKSKSQKSMLNYKHKMEETMKYAISIDIGGTSTRVSLIDENYDVKGFETFRTDSQEPFNTLNMIKTIIESYDKDVVGIG